MNKKVIIITSLIAIVFGSATFAYAKEKTALNEPVITNIQLNEDNSSAYGNAKNDYNKIIKRYDYKKLSKEIKKGNYDAMDNMTNEDYQNMIDFMRESENEDMAEMMKSFSRDDMLSMHEAMKEAGGCHGSNGKSNGMMGNRI